MQETRVQCLGREDPLEKGMAPHSCTRAWRFLWTEKPGSVPPPYRALSVPGAPFPIGALLSSHLPAEPLAQKRCTHLGAWGVVSSPTPPPLEGLSKNHPLSLTQALAQTVHLSGTLCLPLLCPLPPGFVQLQLSPEAGQV